MKKAVRVKFYSNICILILEGEKEFHQILAKGIPVTIYCSILNENIKEGIEFLDYSPEDQIDLSELSELDREIIALYRKYGVKTFGSEYKPFTYT